MFETSVIRAQAQAVRGRASLLTASLIAHSAVVVGAIAMSIVNVEFPKAAPAEYSRAPVFMPVPIPPPLGNPNGGAKPVTQPVQKPAAPVQTAQITAPSTVPDTITPVASTGTGETTTPGTGTDPGPIGVPWGTEGSIGDLDAPPLVDVPAQPAPETKIYQAHEVQAPVLLRKVDPRYPAHLSRVGVNATVIVRCVIGKDGSVREPQVIVPASMAPFNTAVLDVLPQWRYKPATHNGKPVDSYLNLTVTFHVQR